MEGYDGRTKVVLLDERAKDEQKAVLEQLLQP